MSLFKSTAAVFALSLSGIVFSSAAFASPAALSVSQTLPSGAFVKKEKSLKGSWKVVERDGKTFIQFGEDFRAANGPDLKVFLSPSNVSKVTGKTALDGAVQLGVLKETKGVQEYELPAGVDLSSYQSVLVHCEAYSVLWGGGDF